MVLDRLDSLRDLDWPAARRALSEMLRDVRDAFGALASIQIRTVRLTAGNAVVVPVRFRPEVVLVGRAVSTTGVPVAADAAPTWIGDPSGVRVTAIGRLTAGTVYDVTFVFMRGGSG